LKPLSLLALTRAEKALDIDCFKQYTSRQS
jgi:hypothetical protein